MFPIHASNTLHSQDTPQTSFRYPRAPIRLLFTHFWHLVEGTGKKRGRLNRMVLINSWRLFWHNYPLENIQDHLHTISISSRHTPDIARTPPQKPQTSVIRTFNKDIHYPIKSVPEIVRYLQFMQRCVWCLVDVWNCLRSVCSVWSVQNYTGTNSIR